MTTIAYKNGILAADTKMTEGNNHFLYHKLHKVGRVCFGVSGNADDIILFLRWYKAGADLDDKIHDENLKNFGAISLDDFGDPCSWFRYYNLPIVDPFFACGSGADFARAFMATGMSAIEAVKATSKFDNNTNDLVDYYSARTQKIKQGT